jgi:hypothetical protein
VETFSDDAFEFREVSIVGDDKGAGVRVMGGLSGPDCMGKEGTSNGQRDWDGTFSG